LRLGVSWQRQYREGPLHAFAPSFLRLPAACRGKFCRDQRICPSSACDVYDRERQQSVSPDAAIELLKAGNERFVADKTINCDLLAQIKATATAQAPFAAIVGCMDSRVPPELVFDQRIGDIFCARIAGNFVNTDIIGSLEYATKVAGARVIVVLGHSDCGAVKGTIDNVQLGNLTATLANIRPAVDAVTSDGERNSKNKHFVQEVAEKNAELAAQLLMSNSPMMKEMVEAGELRIAWAMHDVATGRVVFSG
jgi:carbonic anhydrase